MNSPNVSFMKCAMQGMWFLKAGHWIAEVSSDDCSSRAIEEFEEALSVV